MYHISRCDGLSQLEPRFIPESRRMYDEKADECICVAPSIVQCLLAICGPEYSGEWLYVYECEENGTPARVSDFNVTHEHRLYHNVNVRYVGRISALVLNEMLSLMLAMSEAGYIVSDIYDCMIELAYIRSRHLR